MNEIVTEKTIDEFSDLEIREEYDKRFGTPEEPDISEFDSREMIAALEDRGELPEAEPPDSIDEITDLLAHAALTSRHAVKAYELLADEYGLMPLKQAQMLCAGRMEDAA